jgi:hypothetical protein
MSDRITKKFLNAKLDTIARLLDIPRSEKSAKAKNRKYYLHLDFYNACEPKNPGYHIYLVDVTNGGVHYFMQSNRLYPNECDRYMQAIIDMLVSYPQMTWIKDQLNKEE